MPVKQVILLPQRTVAERLGVTARTIERWRAEGAGPPFLKVGRGVRYDESDLSAWLAARRRLSTSDPGPSAMRSRVRGRTARREAGEAP